MEPDKFALVDRILKDIDNILRKNLDLSSFDIVPVDSNFQNKSPVLHHDNCLALESWCVKHVYMICYTELMDSNPKHKRRNRIDRDKMVRLLNVALLIHPDLGSLWNRRREMVVEGSLDVRSELRFTKLVLSRKAKSNDAFAYRRWILEGMIKDISTRRSDDLPALISEELRVCSAAAEKCPNNYHSWCHRSWLLQHLAACSDFPPTLLSQLYVSEYSFTEHFIASHISEHSCYHYRQLCIQNVFTLEDSNWKDLEKDLRRTFVKLISDSFPKDSTVQASDTDLNSYSEQNLVRLLLGKELNGCGCATPYSRVCRQLEILFYELTLNDDFIRFYANHETLWYHRRFVMHRILSTVYDYHGVSRKRTKAVRRTCGSCRADVTENKAKVVCYGSDCIESCILYVALVGHDKKFTLERREYGDNYAERHEKYLKFIEGVDI